MLEGLTLETLAFAGFLAFCRIGACFMLMPGFSSVRVPMNVRLFIAVAATWALLIVLWDDILPVAAAATPASSVLLIGSELMVGALIGLVARFYVLSLQFIGTAMAMMAGYGGMVAQSIEEPDPQPALGALISFSALLLLFVFEFHHEMIRALAASYQVAPIAAIFDARTALADLTDTLSESFYIMLRLGSPIIAYGIVVNLAAGLINKLAPQIPVYFISLPFVIAGGLILVYFGIQTFLSLFIDGFLPTTIGR